MTHENEDCFHIVIISNECTVISTKHEAVGFGLVAENKSIK